MKPKTIAAVKPDDGVIDDDEVAALVASGKLVRFEAGTSGVRSAEVEQLRERVARWRPPPKNQDRLR